VMGQSVLRHDADMSLAAGGRETFPHLAGRKPDPD
jgi:hypothetical protein